MLPSFCICLFFVIMLAARCHTCRDNSVDCEMGPWGDWRQCRETCGGGKQYRWRSVTTQQSGSGRECSSTGESRDCNTFPCPVDCVWGSWSSWGECTGIGRNTMSRIRNVSSPAKFGGMQCLGLNTNSKSCEPDYVKPNATECPKTHFMCDEGWNCIKPTLLCNGDQDCNDNSDELNCTVVNSPCPKNETTERAPSIEAAEIGFDILENKASGRILNNRCFSGKCLLQGRGDATKRFRLPVNIQKYQFEARVETGFESSSHESAHNLLKDEKKTISRKIDTSISVLLEEVFTLGLKASYSSDEKHRIMVEESRKYDSKFFRIKSSIRIATFRTLRYDLAVSNVFKQREASLPLHYDYVKYAEFISDFGTHYYSSGVIGGQYEHTFIYDRSELSESHLSEKDQKNCLEFEISLKLDKIKKLNNISGDGKVGYSQCIENSLSHKNGGSFINSASRVISIVKGGSITTAGKLSFSDKQSPAEGDFDAWVASVEHYPQVIDFELAPISNVFMSADKRENMERALAEYFGRFDPDKCSDACDHGTAILINDGKECKCACAMGFTGVSCAETTWCRRALYNQPWHAFM